MTARLLPHSRLDDFVARLLTAAEVIAPRRTDGGDLLYDAVSSPREVAWGTGIPLEPLKRFLMPQRETILEFSVNGKVSVNAVYDERDRVFLGARCCDVTGVGVLDVTFAGTYPDPYYLLRREHSTLIALTCQQPDPTCFCVCGDAGPFLTKGYDQQWTRLEEGMLIEIGSAKGQRLADAQAALLKPAELQHLRQRYQLAKEAETRFGDHRTYVAAAMRKLSMEEVGEEVFAQAADRCVDCGGCAFLCPTCSCFTTTDQISGGEGVRERHWDACNYSCYAREASGHNPRLHRKTRLHARFFHKLSHQWAQRNSRHACVCCGRCLSACMAWAHMPAMAEAIRRGEMQ
jgi:sulfhydrogenase subunit beta (sulfur reductase)